MDTDRMTIRNPKTGDARFLVEDDLHVVDMRTPAEDEDDEDEANK